MTFGIPFRGKVGTLVIAYRIYLILLVIMRLRDITVGQFAQNFGLSEGLGWPDSAMKSCGNQRKKVLPPITFGSERSCVAFESVLPAIADSPPSRRHPSFSLSAEPDHQRR